MRLVRVLMCMLLATFAVACGSQQTSAPTTAAIATVAETSAPAATAATQPTSAPTAASEPTATATAPTAAPAAQSGELTVFAAASLTGAFKEIGAKFEATHPGAKVTFNFAGSQQLAQQIGQGAPADVFASANNSQMNAVITSGEVVSGTQQIFVRNRLVVVYPKDNPGGIATLKDLAKPGLKVVLAAPAVPVGQYALDFLGKASKLPEYTAAYSETVAANVVSQEENVKAVLSKIALGEADAGIVYTTDISGDAASQVGRLDIPDNLNTIASYPIAPITNAANTELAQQFVAYVLSAEAQQILSNYGFLPASVSTSTLAPAATRGAHG